MSPEATEKPHCHASKRGHLSVVNALLRTGRRGRDHASLAVVMGLRVKKSGEGQDPSKTLAGPFFSKRRNCRPGLLRLNRSVLMVVLGMLSLSGKGADPNIPNMRVSVSNKQGAPLLLASYGGHVGVVKALLKAGADMNLPCSRGMAAFMQASRRGHLDVVAELIKAGAGLETADIARGRTALFFAILSSNTGIVKFLLEAGANRTKVEHNGITTPLLLAENRGEGDMVHLLYLNSPYSIRPFRPIARYINVNTPGLRR